MNKIFVITNSNDITTDYLVKKYGTNIDFFRLNVDLFKDYKIKIESNPLHYSISTEYNSISSGNFHSILFRKPELAISGDSTIDLAHRSIYKAIFGLTEIFDGSCLTKPSILATAENKILQLKIAEEVGLKLPKSIISNDRSAVNSFIENKKTIFKFLCNSKYKKADNKYSLGSNIIDENDKLEGLEEMPIYFQEYQPKNYELRINILDEDVFPVKILSQENESTKIDWRNDIPSLEYELIEIPKAITDKLKLMMKLLNISFGIFDLIYFDGEYYFLEVNPNGQWLWLEYKLKLNISQKIIDHLIG